MTDKPTRVLLTVQTEGGLCGTACPLLIADSPSLSHVMVCVGFGRRLEPLVGNRIPRWLRSKECLDAEREAKGSDG